MDRRSFLQGAAGGMLGAFLPQVAPAPMRRVKGVIWLWMVGGMNPRETWNRPEETLPRCAAQRKHLSIVRNIRPTLENPVLGTALMHSGFYGNCSEVDPALGTILAYELAPRPLRAPAFVTIDAPDVPDSELFGEDFRPQPLRRGAILPDPDGLRALLDGQERDWGASRDPAAMRRMSERRTRSEAHRSSGYGDALDLAKEPASVRSSYGAGFGENCLLARRLIQAGSSVVEVGLPGWDVAERVPALRAELDRGMGALIEDLAAKELLRDTVVFCATDQGRSAEGKAQAGGFSVVLAGGSLAGGRTTGEKPLPPHHLFATLFKACGVDGNKIYESEGRKMRYVSENGIPSRQGVALAELF